jgi:acetyl-CoA carboxylase biotin carboxylase subunit
MFKKILIANRGEIAVRVIRACREMGITPVAVYSDVDRAALHVLMAEEAYPIGPSPDSESYLNISRILDVAKRSGSTAIHPGYGFLAENAKFAQACAERGVKFIGPTAAAMEIMGSKTRARQHMEKAGIPFVPGTSHGLESFEQAELQAAKIGYPVMLKAAHGGGGKGMRLVAAASDLKSALESARSEAQRAFGDNEVYIEKAILNPRHIEVQVLADEHGHIVSLGERECSIQRRHQKVLEESPSAAVDSELRQRMGEVAVRAARAAHYTNAGTIEFLLDQNRDFYFLEMNTRLQVEHPVTELVTGQDLVHLQIRIAAGETLGFSQAEVQLRGHAIECRLYAEDPENNFFPSPGKITLLREPGGPGIREDSGMYEGWTVPIDYDPMLAKLVSYGSDRSQAIARLRRALDEYCVGGIKTNVSLFRRIVRDSDFLAGQLDTGYLDRLLQVEEREPNRTGDDLSAVAAIAAGLFTAIEARATDGHRQLRAADANDKAGQDLSNWKKASRLEALR